jgi:excinuclease ABC subunit A
VIKTADWVIDMGPEGGHKGGMVIATGTPEEISAVTESHTGQYLRPILGLPEPVKEPLRRVGRTAKVNGAGRAAKAATKIDPKAAKSDSVASENGANSSTAEGGRGARKTPARQASAKKAAPARR